MIPEFVRYLTSKHTERFNFLFFSCLPEGRADRRISLYTERGCVKMMHPLFRYRTIGFSFFIEYDSFFPVSMLSGGIICRRWLLILDFSTHFLYIKSNGKEGKVHCDLVFSKMPEPFVSHVVFDLSKDGFRLYASLPPMSDTFL